MADTISKVCVICEEDFDGLYDGVNTCDECLEKKTRRDKMIRLGEGEGLIYQNELDSDGMPVFLGDDLAFNRYYGELEYNNLI